MNTETSIVEHTPQTAVPVKQIGDDLLLTADTSHDLQVCQAALIHWCEKKIATEQANYEEIESAYLEAKKNKWASKTLHRHTALAAKRVTFYKKVLEALRNGYAIVPNFPVQLFAIRTTKERPLPKTYVRTNQWGGPRHAQFSDVLPSGVGGYQNPFPVVLQQTKQLPDGKGGTKTEWTTWAHEWADLEFPINMARLEVMQASQRAMALKVFDEIGVLPDPSRPKGDPVIIGRIVDPRDLKSWQNRRAISFMISWHLDTRTL